uniref:Uncharacterized protein n=1 Tax=Solanum lycopersicum TaxID=4081 RepID=A0A3Q7EXW5_SOLLC
MVLPLGPDGQRRYGIAVQVHLCCTFLLDWTHISYRKYVRKCLPFASSGSTFQLIYSLINFLNIG